MRALRSTSAMALTAALAAGCSGGADEAASSPSPSPSASVSASPSPSASPSASPSEAVASPSGGASSGAGGPVTSLRRTDWRNAILDLPGNSTCPAPRVQFRGGTAVLPDPRYQRLEYEMLPGSVPAAYGDLTGDGSVDAVVHISCAGVLPEGPYESSFVVAAYTENEKGGPRPLGVVVEIGPLTMMKSVRIAGPVVTVRSAQGSLEDVTTRHRWNGSGFVKAS